MLSTPEWIYATALRPGHRFAEYKRTLEGRVFVDEEDPDCVIVSLDAEQEDVFMTCGLNHDGVVDYVVYNAALEGHSTLEGLTFSMGIAQMRAKFPDFRIDMTETTREAKVEENQDCYIARRDDETSWCFAFDEGELATIMIIKSEGYPGAQFPRDPHFDDLNLKLAVEEMLLDEGLIAWLPEDDEPEDGLNESRLMAWYTLPLSQDVLDGVEMLELDGVHKIYSDIDPDWNEETYDFDVVSLEGIQHLRNLKRFSSMAMASNLSLAPLAGHPRLEHVVLAPDAYYGMEALLSLPRLKTLVLARAILDEDDEKVVAELERRGVMVDSIDVDLDELS